MTESTRPRRVAYLSALAAALGLFTGGAAWLLLRLIGLITNVALFGRVALDLPSMASLNPGPRLLIVPVLGALAVAGLARWSPIIKGHGIPEAMESVLTNQSRVTPRASIAKPLSAAIAIGTGGPFGAEGPIIVTGGSLGSLIGQVLDTSPSERKILLAAGAAGGMAATFGAPLAAILLAVELLLFEFSSRAVIPLAVSASVAGGVHVALFGPEPLFGVPDYGFAGLPDLAIFVPLGVLSGLAAVAISRGLFVVEAGFRRLPISATWHPVIGAIGFGLVGLAVPQVLGVGYDLIEQILTDQLTLGALALLAIAKLVAWWIALGSGTSGGTLAPMLIISGAFGAVVGHLTLAAFPSTGLSPGAFALVAMAATFGAATRATLTSVVFVFELTRSYESILPLILAAVIADLIAIWLLPNTLMTEKLARRGLRVSTDLRSDFFATATVANFMAQPVTSLPVESGREEALALMAESGHSAIPLTDGNRVCGIVTRSDLLSQDAAATTIALGRRQVVVVAPTDPLSVAIERMSTERVEHLPVTAFDGTLVGICTRTDVLAAHAGTTIADNAQPGWRHRIKGPRPSVPPGD